MMMLNKNILAKGHVFAKDADTGEVLIDTSNDVHLENFSRAIAMSLARYDYGAIDIIQFGNGGTMVSSTGAITYNSPNVTGPLATLHNSTYEKVVNDKSSLFDDDSRKTNIRYSHIDGNEYSDIIITCTLGYGEPADGQRVYDDATVKDNYTFDEVGLFAIEYSEQSDSSDSVVKTRKLLTHAIFHPVQKSANRAIELTYTIRINMV